MRRLRQKVEVDPNQPKHLLTVRGIGYRLVARGPSGTSETGATTPIDDDQA
jgi:hypothetical protein